MSTIEAPAARRDIIRLRPEDEVAVATRHLFADEVIDLGGETLTVRDRVSFGHKIALAAIAKGQPVHKYGQVIGFATQPIDPGEHVHSHNLACDAYERQHEFSTAIPEPWETPVFRTFQGYERTNGKVGTRNYLAVVSTVNCSASVSRGIVARFTKEVLAAYPNVDGVIAVTHKTGCGMSASGLDRLFLQRVLAGFARHPNVFDYVVMGLGCEVNQADEFIDAQQLLGLDNQRPPVITIQGAGGTQRAIELGVEQLALRLPAADACRRTQQPASKLVLATECGGSDAYSGITANPAVGIAADLLIAQGGTSILAETPEIYGAEHLLTRRAVTPEVGQKLVDRIRWWEWYTETLGAKLDNNPSQGNKAGGLTTIYEKSLGAIAKAGSSALADVVEYAEPVTTPGLVVMDTPGFDPPSVTGMVAGGANVVVFTTGRGSAYGCKPTPSIKVASNTPLYQNMPNDMDLDAGTILDGRSVEQVGRELFEQILDVASGTPTQSERQGLGDEEFAPWTVGPVL